MTERIRSFTEEFTVKDNATFYSNYDGFIRHIEGMMRDQGYVPFLDLAPRSNVSYNEKGAFECMLTVYGIWVGDKAWDIDAIADGKKYERYTLSPKSRLS